MGLVRMVTFEQVVSWVVGIPIRKICVYPLERVMTYQQCQPEVGLREGLEDVSAGGWMSAFLPALGNQCLNDMVITPVVQSTGPAPNFLYNFPLLPGFYHSWLAIIFRSPFENLLTVCDGRLVSVEVSFGRLVTGGYWNFFRGVELSLVSAVLYRASFFMFFDMLAKVELSLQQHMRPILCTVAALGVTYPLQTIRKVMVTQASDGNVLQVWQAGELILEKGWLMGFFSGFPLCA